MPANFFRTVFAVLAAAAVATLSSCSTTKGFGEDLQKVGSKIEHKSEEVQRGY